MQVTDNHEAFMDFNLPANAKLKIEEVLGEADSTVRNTYDVTYRTNTHGTTVTDTFTDYSPTAPEITIAQSDKIQIIEVKNKRKTKDVIIKKKLNDSTVTAAQSFNFKATLYALDGTTPVEGHTFTTAGENYIITNSETHVSLVDPENPDYIDPEAGTVQFTLKPQSGNEPNNTAYLKLGNVPYGAYLNVEEIPVPNTNYSTSINGYEGISSMRQVLVDRIDITNVDPDTAVDDNDAFVFENKIEGKNLIISKAVTGEMMQGGETFDFTVTGLGSALTSESYKILNEIYDSNGKMTGTEEVTPDPSPVYTSSEGKLTFTLAHHQRILIKGIPAQSNILIHENDYTGCVPHYVVKRTTADGTTTSVDQTDTIGHDINISLDSHKKVEIRNDFPAVAPTGHQSSHKPFLLLLLFGVFLLIGGGLIRNQTKTFKGIETSAARPQGITTTAMSRCSRDYRSFCVRGYVPIHGKAGSMQADSVADPKGETAAGQHEIDSTQAAKKQMHVGMNKNLFQRGTPWIGGGSM